MEQAKCRNCGSALIGEYCAACGQREGRGELRSSEALAGFVFMSMLTLALMQHGSIVFSFYRTVDDRSDAILCYYLWLECRGAV